MLSFKLKRINLSKFFLYSFLSFLLPFSICIILVWVFYEITRINFISLFLILIALFQGFITYPLIIKKSSESIVVQWKKDKITIYGESYTINNVDKMRLRYRNIIFPNLKITLVDNHVKNFYLIKYRDDYMDFEDEIRNIDKKKKPIC